MSATVETSGHRYLAEALAAYGVSHVFMVPTIVPRTLAEAAGLGVRVILAHSEKAAAYMADGYARAAGRPGVCLAQTIGATNLASGLRDAFLAGSPVVAITGGRSPLTKHRHVYQEAVDQPAFGALTKWTAELDDVGRLPDMVRQLFRTATSGAPGPVHLQLQGHEGKILDGTFVVDDATGPPAEARFAAVPPFRPGPDPADVQAAVACLARARRPVLVAGGGVTRSGAGAEAVALAELLDLPLATTLNAKGCIAEDHPLSIGVIGAYSRRPANELVMEADLVVFFGSRAGSQSTSGWRVPPPGTPVIQLDIDPAELGRNYPNVVSILADAKAGLSALMEAAAAGPPVDRSAWRARIAQVVGTWRATKAEVLASSARPIRPERLCAELTDALPDDGVLVVDTGHAGIWTGSLVELKPTQRYLRAAGSLGWGLPAAMGAKCALPERPVVCFSGDGGAYYHLAELETAVRHDLPVVVVVNDNRSLSQDMKVFDRAYDDAQDDAGRAMWMFSDMDFAKVAEAMGCAAYRVEDPGDIAGALRDALGSGRPALIDVVTDLMALPDPPFGGGSSYA